MKTLQLLFNLKNLFNGHYSSEELKWSEAERHEKILKIYEDDHENSFGENS